MVGVLAVNFRLMVTLANIEIAALDMIFNLNKYLQ